MKPARTRRRLERMAATGRGAAVEVCRRRQAAELAAGVDAAGNVLWA